MALTLPPTKEHSLFSTSYIEHESNIKK